MKQESQFANRIEEFQFSVSRHFHFLTTDHGFRQRGPIVRDVDSAKDASVSIVFDRSDLRITIGLGLIDSGLGISVRDNNWLEKPAPPPGRQRVKTVNFEYLVEFLTDGKSKPIVPHYGDGSTHRFNTVRKQIDQSLDSVVERLALKVCSFSSQILDGDITAVFAEADEYYKKKRDG